MNLIISTSIPMKKTLAATLIGLAVLTSIAGSAYAAEMPTDAELNAILCERLEGAVAKKTSDAETTGAAVIAEVVSDLDAAKLEKAGINLDAILSEVRAGLADIPTAQEVIEAETSCPAQ